MKKFTIFVMLCAVLCVLSGCIKIEIPANVPEKDDTPAKVETTVPDTPALPAVVEDTENPPTPQPAPSPAPAQPEAPAASIDNRAEMLAAYEEILDEVCQSYENHERKLLFGHSPSFALYDADRDGQDELIVQDPGDEKADQWIRVYGYEDGTGAYLKKETHTNCFYYDNGVFEFTLSHNQIPVQEQMWAHRLYQYTSASQYQLIAAVYGWDKSVTDFYDGVPFPDEVDKDGDGFVYCIVTGENGFIADSEHMDQAEYDAWRQSYMEGTEYSSCQFLPLVRENISLQ